jgi:predicted Zn-dependent peptidase
MPRVDAGDVQAATQRYICPDEVAIVVVGDAAQIEAELATVAAVTRVADPLAPSAD